MRISTACLLPKIGASVVIVGGNTAQRRRPRDGVAGGRRMTIRRVVFRPASGDYRHRTELDLSQDDEVKHLPSAAGTPALPPRLRRARRRRSRERRCDRDSLTAEMNWPSNRGSRARSAGTGRRSPTRLEACSARPRICCACPRSRPARHPGRSAPRRCCFTPGSAAFLAQRSGGLRAFGSLDLLGHSVWVITASPPMARRARASRCRP